MDQVQRAFRFTLFSVWAVFMTALTFVLGAPPLKVLRRRMGRAPYWALTLGMCLVLFALHAKILALSFLTLVILMGVFEEFEEMGFGFQSSALYALIINVLVSAGGFALWVSRTGPAWRDTLTATIEAALKPLADLNTNFHVNPKDVMLQLPSVAIVLWMIAIYVAVLLESRLSGWDMAAPDARPTLRPQLAEFRLPDAMVWAFIASLLGAFGNFHHPAVEALAVNTMNVCMVLFFFQGIAVVSRFFAAIRMGIFWQGVFMVLIVVQLFLFVSLLGLLDYWLNFRARLAKRSERFNREA